MSELKRIDEIVLCVHNISMILPESETTSEPNVASTPPATSVPPAQTPPATTPQTPSQTPPKNILKLLLDKKWPIPTLVLFVVIILVIVFFSVSNHDNKNINITNSENKPIASVGDKPIYLEDLKKVALEKNPASSTDTNAIRLAFAVLTERIILDSEAKKLNVSVSDRETEQRIITIYPTPKELSSQEKKELSYNLLKEKIMEKSVESREAYSIRAELPPYSQYRDQYTTEQLEFFQQQKDAIDKLLPDVEERLRHADIFLNIAQSVYKEYPDLQAIMEVNEYNMHETKDEKLLKNPKLYFYDRKRTGDLFFDTIFALHTQEIKLINHQSNPGGYVIMLKKINNQGIFNYDDWLAAKKKELVKTFISI